MLDADAGHRTDDPGPIETGPVTNITADDPGPIEIDVVMKGEWVTATDPMAGRDLHLGETSDDEQ
jgi:hypothetical protein